MRTHNIHQIGLKTIGTRVKLCGWIETIRDHGGLLFFHLRDASGRIQVVVDPQQAGDHVWDLANQLHPESCVRFSGTIVRRLEKNRHTSLDTKEIELEPNELEILNTCIPLPFRPQLSQQQNEELRLRHRYLDLRSDTMQINLKLRSNLQHRIRQALHGFDFTEIETPYLTRSTPEGARDFLVPSRVHSGRFFALPQSPQLFKQLLMMGGIENYFQFARCFRDEDLRANRQPEFTQLDLEMAFVEEEEVFQVVESIISEAMGTLGLQPPPNPFPRMSYDQAMLLYGTDTPDTRFGMDIIDLTHLFTQTGFQVFGKMVASGGAVKAIVVPTVQKPSRGTIDGIRKYAASLGKKEPAWATVNHGRLQSPIAKFWNAEETRRIIEVLAPKEGNLVLFMAELDTLQVSVTLGKIREFVADQLGLRPGPEVLSFSWVWGFPMFEKVSGSVRLKAVHHPFTQPNIEGDLFSEDQTHHLNLRSRAYDLVANGQEIGGGSLRIHRPEIQERVFQILGLSKSEMETQFGFFLNGLRYGAPPHGGIALGLDRLTALLASTPNIRDVMAFPKSKTGHCPLTGAPASVDRKQLQSVHISTWENTGFVSGRKKI